MNRRGADFKNTTCPTCGPVYAKCTDTRPKNTDGLLFLQRRRHCPICDSRFTTVEFPYSDFNKLMERMAWWSKKEEIERFVYQELIDELNDRISKHGLTDDQVAT